MNNTKMFRLRSGEDVITQIISETKQTYTFKSPMAIRVRTESRTDKDYVDMHYWLPYQILLKNEIELSKNEIQFEMIPSDSIVEFYDNQIYSMQEKEELREALDTLENAHDTREDSLLTILRALPFNENSKVH
jgi:hypothetical protein